MGRIESVKKQTDNRFLNMYQVKATSVHNTPVNYFVASRAEDIDHLKLVTKENHPDGVAIYSLYGEKKDRVVLIRQYRYPIGDYIYEFPAGLVEKGEDYHNSAVREMKEETGLTFHPMTVDEIYEKPFFTTVGMTDESCATVYGVSEGEISKAGQEDSEEIEVVLADREEVKRILREENVALLCAYQLMHFLKNDDPFAFLERK
ncbi:MAG: NUDIX hydrolase [Eubacteriales bacterium]|nr:NUDIX hydrolase [Eubacteriales bacterium]